MRAQVAFEYMLVMILVLAFLTPIWIYVNSVERSASGEISYSYAKNTVDRLASASDLVYSQGYPARVKVTVNIPSGVVYQNVSNHTINLRVSHAGAESDIFAETRGDVNGTLPTSAGSHNVEVEARDGHVQITPV